LQEGQDQAFVPKNAINWDFAFSSTVQALHINHASQAGFILHSLGLFRYTPPK
jgi:hypothetical protein